jgi:hypothetical protein
MLILLMWERGPPGADRRPNPTSIHNQLRQTEKQPMDITITSLASIGIVVAFSLPAASRQA